MPLQRIASLVPSATEIVCALGLESQLVAVSHECDYPPSVGLLPKITRLLIPPAFSSAETDRLVRDQIDAGNALYSLDTRLLAVLRPELIVTQSLCSVCAVAEREVLTAAQGLFPNPRIITLTPERLADVFQSLHQVAQAAEVETRADEVIATLRDRVRVIQDRTKQIVARPRVAFLEWLDPPFCAGHWNPELVSLAGGVDGFGRAGQPSRTLTWSEIIAWRPEVILIACCGYTIERARLDCQQLSNVAGWFDLPAVKDQRVFITDGSQYFNRPGPRLVDSLEIMAHAIHPEHHPRPKNAPAAQRWK